jgi:hypothetical protein
LFAGGFALPRQGYFMNLFLHFINSNPLAYQYIGCTAAGVLGLLAAWLHSRRTKRAVQLLQGPVPKLSERALLTEFEAKLEELREKAATPGFFTGLFSVICIFLMFWLYRQDYERSPILIADLVLQSSVVLVYLFGSLRHENQASDLLAGRPELASLKYLNQLPQETKKSTDGKLFWATLDDFVCAFDIGKSAHNSPALEANQAKFLSDAQWTATHDEKPLQGELALIVWRDGSNHKIKAVVTKITSVEDAPAETLITRPGIAIIKAASQKFCGGRVAHYSDTPNEKIERGWLATADRAHILLASNGSFATS